MKELIFIDEMFSLQQSLNDTTCGNGWENGYTKEKRPIDFARCIYMECAELIDSVPWKHWKNINANLDLENIQIELVDIWHFILSLAIMKKSKEKVKKIFSEYKFNNNTKDLNQILESSRDLIHLSSDKNIDIEKIVFSFLNLMTLCDLKFEKLYKIYLGKNVLNKFRQDNGYKDGAYKKIWNGKEDNVIMYELLENEIGGFDDLYARLDKIYKRI